MTLCIPRRETQHNSWPLVLLWLIALQFQEIRPASAQVTVSTIPFSYSSNVYNPGVFQLTPDDRNGLFRVSDTIGIATTNGNPFRVLNTFGNVVYEGTSTNMQFSQGHYFVETDGDRTQFAVLPDDYAPTSLPSSQFTGAWFFSDRLNALLGPSWERTGLGGWSVVQPQRDVWDWSQMDQGMAALAGTNRKIIYLGGDSVPSWVGTNELVTAYTQFATAAMRRYGSKLYGWEIWNEPWYTKFGGTNEMDVVPVLMNLTRAADSVRKTLHLNIKLVGPTWASPRIRTESDALVQQGILKMLDYWSFHDYDMRWWAPDENDSWAMPIPSRLATNFGPLVAKKPMLVTEIGLYGTSALGANLTHPDDETITMSGLSWYRGFCRTIKTTIMYRAAGVVDLAPQCMGLFGAVSNSNWEIYGWDESPAPNNNVYAPRGPHPKTSAFLMTCYWLNHAKLGDSRVLDGQVYLYTWKRPRTGMIVFAWCVEGQSRAIAALPGFRMTDIYGNDITPGSLGEEPILFRPLKGGSARNAANAVAAALSN